MLPPPRLFSAIYFVFLALGFAVPQPASAQPNVPIVDFGDDLSWHGGTQGLPTYRGEAVVRLFKGSRDGANPIDVDGDGQTDDDSIAYYEFSMDRTFNPEGSFYNVRGNNTKFYGGAATFWGNRKPRWAEGGINVDHELRDDLNLHSYATEGGEVGLQTYGVWLWKKEDFRNDGDELPVVADADSRIAVYISRYWKEYEEGRFVIQNGEDFFISEHSFRDERHTLQAVNILATRWAPYQPSAPYNIAFDPATADFQNRSFDDITAAGWYVAKPTLGEASLWLKWYAFSLEAVVQRPKAASHLLSMKPIGGGRAITEGPVSYAAWRQVEKWVNRNQYGLFEGYTFDRNGDMGLMFLREGPFSSSDPVTDMTWYDALAWSNALSEYEGYTPVFYTDPGFTKVFREVLDRMEVGSEEARPEVYVKWDADGFRPATQEEHPNGAGGLYIVRSMGGSPTDAGSAMSFWKNHYQPLDVSAVAANPQLEMKTIPAGSYKRGDRAVVSIAPFYFAETATTFEQWRAVYAWAVGKGYQFDRDGDLGSMTWSDPDTSFTINHPVTGISHNDVMLWMNALSEMEGKTPVYYEDPGFQKVYREARRFRPENTEKGPAYFHLSDKGAQKVYVRWDVDGYRLPTVWEWSYAYRGGADIADVIPWGNEAADAHAWIGTNSGDQTHGVGQKPANGLGLYGMAGNTFEWTMGGGQSYYTTENPRGEMYPIAKGGSFRTAGREIPLMLKADGQPRMAIKSPMAFANAEIGFRVARYDAGTHPSEEPPYVPKKVLDLDTTTVDPLANQVWRGNLSRTGEFNAPGPQSAPTERWSFDTGSPVKASPVVVDGVVYIGSRSGTFYALDLQTGQELWSVSTGAPIEASAAVYAGKVFFGNNQGLFALDAKTGAEVWKVSGGKWEDSPLVLPGPVALADGTPLEGVVFYSQPWNNLVGVDSATGEEIWRYRDGKGPGRKGSSALYHQGKVIHFRGSQATEVVDLLTERRSYAIDGAVDSGVFTPAARDGIAYSYIHGVVGFDIEANLANAGQGSHMNNYNLLWRHYPEDPLWDYQHPGISSLSVDERHVYFGHRDTFVYALDRETGSVAWKTKTGGVNRSSPAIGNAALLFIGSYDNNVYGINRATGSIAWSYGTGDSIHSSPAIAGNKLLIGSDDGKVYALE